MAYWQFDLTFVNLGALPAGTAGILVKMIAHTNFEALAVGQLPESGDLTITASTAEPGGIAIGPYPVFELSASDQVWFVVRLLNGTNTVTDLYSIGPYTVGDIGAEVAPEL